MKIGVVGGGVSGITFAINRKKNNPNDEVIVFEHLDKVLKKILSTGNGKCNIGNKLVLPNMREQSLVKDILSKYDYDYQNSFLDSINIKTKLINSLSYPISESAITVRNAYLNALEKYGVKVITESQIIDYKVGKNQIVLSTNNGEFKLDKLVFATGGKSSPKLGSDGSILPILENHKYKLKNFEPALCPIYTKEKTKILDGTRVKAVVKLLLDNEIVYEEYGELLFKEHGLSGIVIFNISRLIAMSENKNFKFKIDLVPEVNNNEMKFFLNNHTTNELLNAYLHPNIVKYIESLKVKNNKIIDTLKELDFTFDKLYGFDYSQVSVGGIRFEDINENLESKTEKGVYFLGELLDFSAPCGGYNLMWAIGSALYLSDNL